MPDFTSLGSPQGPQPAGGVAQIDPGQPRYVGMAGSAIQGAARDIEDASSIIAQANERQNELVAQGAGNQLAQVRINTEFDPNEGFRSVKGAGVLGQQFLDQFGQKFSDAQQAIRSSLQNDQQRQMFDRMAQVQSLQFKGALLQHQARETDFYNDKTADDTINLALRTAAQDPTNELTFQTSLAQINAMVDATATRKGLAAQTAQELKGRYLDAAYTTRIMSIAQGIPGVVQSSPYLAEKMFEQVQSQLGPQAQTTLGHQILTAVKGVQARDTAQAFIFGNRPPLAPADIAPAATGPALQGVVQSLESGGQRYDDGGHLLTSPKGAQGEMQVMPATAANPGFGVTPAKDNSPQELARVGRDYLGAMSARYNDPSLVLAAYNAGPGQVDKWIAKFGDPRTGAITPQEWAAKIPFTETRDYVMAGLKKLASANGGGPINAPTPNQLKGDLYSRVQQARAIAEQQYPGDAAYADAVAARVENYGRMVLANATAQQQAAHDTLMQGVIGQKQDGSDRPQTIDQLLADPQMKAAWDQASPDAKDALLQRFAKGDKQFDKDSFALYYGLLGQAQNPESRVQFLQTDLGQYFGKMPDSHLLQLANLQKSLNMHDSQQADRDLNWGKAKSSVEDMLRPIGLGSSAKPNTDKARMTEQFYGQLSDALQTYHDQNKKWPDTQTTRQFAAGLLAEGKQRDGLIWDSSTRAFLSPDQSKFYVPLPSDKTQRAAITQTFTKVMGHAPTDTELQAYWTRYKLSGGK